jgi:hypothetical protein
MAELRERVIRVVVGEADQGYYVTVQRDRQNARTDVDYKQSPGDLMWSSQLPI